MTVVVIDHIPQNGHRSEKQRKVIDAQTQI